MSAEYFSAIGLRLSFIVGVSSSRWAASRPSTIVNFHLFGAARAAVLAARRPPARPCEPAHRAQATRVRCHRSPAGRQPGEVGIETISAVLYGRRSPMQQACPMSGEEDFSAARCWRGHVLAAALMMSSFLRSTMSGTVLVERADVAGPQPAVIGEGSVVVSLRLRVAEHHDLGFQSTSRRRPA